MNKEYLPISVVIIVKGRRKHLLNVLEGISRNSFLPQEVVIVSMNEPLKLEKKFLFDVKIIEISLSNQPLPLAYARNTGARSAKEDLLFFLDVDCIPSETYLEEMYDFFEEKNNGFLMATPRYLEEPVKINFSQEMLRQNSVFHPHRPRANKSFARFDHYELFWSLCFAIRRSDFDKIKGFDTSFTGYGAEDTDFGFTARELRLPFNISQANVFHQPHDVCSPPLHHFKDIIHNAEVFYQKWKTWAMPAWLSAFSQMNLIEWQENQKPPIKILSYPTEEQIKKTRKPMAAFA